MDPSVGLLQVDAVFHGRYRVVRRIAAGGMGAIFEVVDQKTNSRRALKVMLASALGDPDFRARFESEALITGPIESDHLVRVSDAGVDAATDMPFLVMDLLTGEDLGAVLEKRGALPPDEVVVLLSQLARALDKTHAAGIVHRDLKPENLFLTRRDDGSPCVKVLDFGIAKLVAGPKGNKATRALGTPFYMSPEQVGGDGAIGPRADLYSLGHIAYTLLTGEPYWFEDSTSAPSPYAFVMHIVGGPREPAGDRALRRGGVLLSPAFSDWFQKITAPNPEARFERATLAVSALAEALGTGQPVMSSQASAALPALSAGPARSAQPSGSHPVYSPPAAPAITGALGQSQALPPMGGAQRASYPGLAPASRPNLTGAGRPVTAAVPTLPSPGAPAAPPAAAVSGAPVANVATVSGAIPFSPVAPVATVPGAPFAPSPTISSQAQPAYPAASAAMYSPYPDPTGGMPHSPLSVPHPPAKRSPLPYLLAAVALIGLLGVAGFLLRHRIFGRPGPADVPGIDVPTDPRPDRPLRPLRPRR